jgi:hypothetical protein
MSSVSFLDFSTPALSLQSLSCSQVGMLLAWKRVAAPSMVSSPPAPTGFLCSQDWPEYHKCALPRPILISPGQAWKMNSIVLCHLWWWLLPYSGGARWCQCCPPHGPQSHLVLHLWTLHTCLLVCINRYIEYKREVEHLVLSTSVTLLWSLGSFSMSCLRRDAHSVCYSIDAFIPTH